MLARTSITAGSASIVAEMSVDPAAVNGTGGALSPMLSVPVGLDMVARPAGAAIGIELLLVELWLPGQTLGLGGRRLGEPSLILGIGGPPPTLVSGPSGPRHDLVVNFAIAPAQVAALEAHADRATAQPVVLELRAIAKCAVVEDVSIAQPVGDGRAFHDAGYRLVSLPQSAPTALQVAVPRELWAENILPGLGRDRLRLVPVVFPASSDGPGDAGERFDEARRHLDAGRWRDAVKACRDVRYAVEQELGARGGVHVHAVLAERRGLDPSALAFFDDAWNGLGKLTTQATHRNTREPDELPIGAPEARAAVRLAAVLLDYARFS